MMNWLYAGDQISKAMPGGWVMAFFVSGLTENDVADKDTGEMKKSTVIKKSCTRVVQNGFYRQLIKKIIYSFYRNPLNYLEPASGFEPLTC